MIKRIMQLDVALPGSQQAIYTRKGEVQVYALDIRLCERSVPVVFPEGATAVLRAHKPDGHVVCTDAIIREDRIRAYLGSQALTAEGVMVCRVDVFGVNGEALYSPCFDVLVEGTLLDGEMESTDDFAALKKMAEQMQQEVAEVAASIEGMTVSAHSLPPALSGPTAVITDDDGHKHISFGLIPGQDGVNGVVMEVVAGQYAFEVDAAGDLWLVYEDGEQPPTFEIVGNDLYMVVGG